MITIFFESHSTTPHNEEDIASGQYDVGLSDNGRLQAHDLGRRYRAQDLDAILTSDLKRAYNTAEIAFEERPIDIITDSRLRETDYGKLTHQFEYEIEPQSERWVSERFPGGESHEEAVARVGNFLKDLHKHYDGKTVMIIGHRATQYGLEHLIEGKPLAEVVTAPWAWQPGWTYFSQGFYA